MIRLFSKKRKKKQVKIEFCEKNLDRHLQKDHMAEYEKFFRENKLSLEEYECQSHCELCGKMPYAVMNGEMITADNDRELLKKMKSKLDFLHNV